MRAEYYADQYRRYATYVRNFGENKIYKIAGGASVDDYHWTEVLMREAGKQMNGLSLHYYTRVSKDWAIQGSATDFEESEWFSTNAECSLYGGTDIKAFSYHGSV